MGELTPLEYRMASDAVKAAADRADSLATSAVSNGRHTEGRTWRRVAADRRLLADKLLQQAKFEDAE